MSEQEKETKEPASPKAEDPRDQLIKDLAGQLADTKAQLKNLEDKDKYIRSELAKQDSLKIRTINSVSEAIPEQTSSEDDDRITLGQLREEERARIMRDRQEFIDDQEMRADPLKRKYSLNNNKRHYQEMGLVRIYQMYADEALREHLEPHIRDILSCDYVDITNKYMNRNNRMKAIHHKLFGADPRLPEQTNIKFDQIENKVALLKYAR